MKIALILITIVVIASILLFFLYWSVRTPYQNDFGYVTFQYLPDERILIVYLDEEKVIISDVNSLEEAKKIIQKRIKNI